MGLRSLDERVLGERGIAAIACGFAALFLAGTISAFATGAWPPGIFYAVLTAWVGYWAYRRVRRLRERHL